MSRDMRDWEIGRCHEKIMQQEIHIGRCEKIIAELRDVKVRNEDEIEKLLQELERYKEAAGRVM